MKINKLLVVLMLLTLTFNASAQDPGGDDVFADHKNDLLVVVGGGLAGAILGLSTLSFVEEPKEHTRNILVGASLGIIAGVGYVAFNQANKQRDFMLGPPPEDASLDPKEFDTGKRVAWHYQEVNEKTNFINSLNQINYSFKF
jgi:hypothetical protein